MIDEAVEGLRAGAILFFAVLLDIGLSAERPVEE